MGRRDFLRMTSTCAVCSEPATVTTTFGEPSCGHPACLAHHYARRFKFDRGDWVAHRNPAGMWRLAGKVVDADSESITVERNGLRAHFAVGEDPIAHVCWRGRRWFVR